MISNIKGYDLTALIESGSHRKFLENFESDLLRGIGKISILKIIKNYGKEGVYGYQLLKDLKEKTNDILIIKEGTLYPLLRNLEKWESKGNSLSLIKIYNNIEDSIQIEIQNIMESLSSLPEDKIIAVMCYGGGLSKAVTRTLVKNGFSNAKNLKGGFVRWALDIDPELLEYL